VKRFHQALLIGSVLPLSWLGMMAVHEFGHVLGAWYSGGTVAKVVLHPLTISRTDLAHNPHPLLVAWAGPVLGVIFPLAAFGAAAAVRLPGAYLLRFFAGFCLIANGGYIGGGSFDRLGDARDLLRHGAPLWQLWAFGAAGVAAGLLLWHRLGWHFGLGKAKGQVSRGAAYGCLVALVIALAVTFLFGGE
jgi:hypothetical protein